MKQALQAILIAPDSVVRLAIMLGEKKVTIREGHRDYHVGPVMICCHLVPWAIMATITSVRFTQVNEVTEKEMRADGYSNHKEMLNDLRKYYPDLTMSSPVTVISWGNVTGALAEDKNIERYAKKHRITEYLLGNPRF
jgi:hypothetical protein